MRRSSAAMTAVVGLALAGSAIAIPWLSGPDASGPASDASGVVVAEASSGSLAPVAPVAQAQATQRPIVIHISVDGLRSGDETRNLQTLIDRGEAPAFARLQREGLWTHNARTDVFHTNTLPNHTTMLTGRPVEDVQTLGLGHRYRWNDDPETPPTSQLPVPALNLSTLHTSAGDYVPSVFNVASDAGLSTALYVSKDKFSLFDQSYDGVDQPGDPAFEAAAGADRTGADDGADKIDHYVYEGNIAAMTDRFLADIGARGASDYSFLHFNAPDSAGHANGWGSPAYLAAIRATDVQLGRILDHVSRDPNLASRAVIILSADHGGGGDRPVTDAQHGTPASPLNFTIPFYVWGAGIARGDIYAYNPVSRASPSPLLNPLVLKRGGTPPPIRNGDGGNLALGLLGLGAIPNSSLNQRQDLNVRGQRAG